MRYLENAFKFTFKNFIITLPLLIGMAIPALIMGVGSLGFMFNLGNFQQTINDIASGGDISSIRDLYLNLYGPTMIISMIISGIVSLGLTIVVYPITYGLINKKYETGSSNLSDMTAALSKYIGRFVLYLLLTIAIVLGLSLILLILIAIGGVIAATVSVPIGIMLIVVFSLAFIVAFIALFVYMSLWFPAVCVEDTGIIDGLKNSFKYVRGSFWQIFGISLLISICGGIASWILGGILGLIPIVGTAVGSVVSTLANFITIVFYFEVYRDKSGHYASREYYQQLNGDAQ